jgi:hypothetical protein
MSDKILSRAQTFEDKQKLDAFKVQEGLAKYTQREQLAERLESSSLANLEAAKGKQNALRLIGSLEKDAALVRQAVPFINPTMSAMCPLCPGGLVLIGAASGTGKSTTAAAIAHALYVDKKHTFIISNEETAARVVGRIACAELGVDFNLFIEDKAPPAIRKMVAQEILNVEPYVTVADDSVATTTVESIEKLMREVDESGRYSAIIIDFAQRVVKSTTMPSAERVQVLYAFKDMITDYSQHAKTPVVLFTQLVPLASDEDERNFESRVKWARGLVEAAATAIEVIKVKGLPVSTFYMAKRRFGSADVSISCRYENGRFHYISKNDMQKLKDETTLNRLKDSIASSPIRSVDDGVAKGDDDGLIP